MYNMLSLHKYIIKSGLINLIKIGNVFTTGKGLACKSVARDSWHLKPKLNIYRIYKIYLFQ